MDSLFLKKITSEEVAQFAKKKVYLVCFFKSYIEDLYNKFLFDGEIAGVFDEDTSKHGDYVIEGHNISVFGTDQISLIPEESVLIICTGYFEEEYEKIKKINISKKINNTVYFLANLDTEYYIEYHRLFADRELENTIIFRSSTGTWEYVPGMDYTDNAKALFEYLIRNNYNSMYKLVWIVKNPNEYRDIESANENVEFMSFDWATSEDEELRYLYYKNVCLAKYFFFTQANAFCRLKRDGQVRIQLWHGCGPKAERFPYRQEKHYEFMPATSDYYAEACVNDFGLKREQVLVTGIPKADWLKHPIKGWKDVFSVPKTEKVIFWLPTFRNTDSILDRFNTNIDLGDMGLPLIRSVEELKNLNNWLCEKKAVLVIKKHPLQKDIIVVAAKYSNIVFLDNKALNNKRLHINQLIGDSDALISDYSSVVVDYLLVNKPIGFVLDDLNLFRKNRGLYKDFEEKLPGCKIYTLEDLKMFIASVISERDDYRDIRAEVIGYSLKYRDDGSCRRIVEFLGI